MTWEIEFTDQFEEWFAGLTGDEQDQIDASVTALQRHGPGPGRP